MSIGSMGIAVKLQYKTNDPVIITGSYYLESSAHRMKRTHDLTDVNPVVQNCYRGPHGSLILRAVSSAQSR